MTPISAPHAVLLDFTSGVDNPAIAYPRRRKLRHECAIEP